MRQSTLSCGAASRWLNMTTPSRLRSLIGMSSPSAEFDTALARQVERVRNPHYGLTDSTVTDDGLTLAGQFTGE